MPHVRPYLDLDVTAGGAHFISYSYSVVAQHFITADENKRRREAGRVPVKRRGVRIARVSAGEAKIAETWRQFDRYQRVDEGIEMQRLASGGEISPSQDHDRRCRQFDALVAPPQQGRQTQAAA